MGVVTHKQLFDLKKDPLEMNNLIEDKSLQNTLTELENELQILIKQTKDPAILSAPDFGLYAGKDIDN